MQKKVICVLLAVTALSLTLTACGGGAAKSSLSGAPAEILTKINEDIKAAGVQTPVTTPPQDVTPETAQNTVGLSEESFNENAASASSSMAAIGTFAHQLAVIQAKDENAAKTIKEQITGEGGYDAGKWICVRPDKAIAVESGVYVLLAAASGDVCDAAVKAFTDAAGTVGEVTVFYEAPK